MEMALQVVHRGKGQVPAHGYPTREVVSDQERSGEAGSTGRRHRIDVIERESGV
jgi:hypothetical protein